MGKTSEGWYPDPSAPGVRRYWNGSTWTEWIVRTDQPNTLTRPAGETLQNVGRSIFTVGASITWIVAGLFVLFVLFVLFMFL